MVRSLGCVVIASCTFSVVFSTDDVSARSCKVTNDDDALQLLQRFGDKHLAANNLRPQEHGELLSVHAYAETSSNLASCHTAVPGEACYSSVTWAMEVGIRQDRDWYPSYLTPSSSFVEFQAYLHSIGVDNNACPAPCMNKPTPSPTSIPGWIDVIEGEECVNVNGIVCTKDGDGRHFKFPAGSFTVPRQVSIPANTVIEGIANPNIQDKTKKPDYTSQTVFVASDGVSDGNVCYCQNLEKSWEPLSPSNPYHCSELTIDEVRSLRKGFLLSSDTVVKNIAFQGKDTIRPLDNGALCGGGVFETPGCVHNQCEFPHLMTGDGKPVRNITIVNVRLNDYSDDPNLSSQLAVWVAQTTDTKTPTRDILVENLVAMSLHADGINFHGFVHNAVVDDSYIQNTGDDIYVVWGGHFDTKDIVFKNSVAVDAGRTRDNHYGSCAAVYGAAEATFSNLTCFAPEQNTQSCYDAKHNGETCNGCLGIIKTSFDANYAGSKFTFTGNHFFDLKRTEDNDGRQIYDFTNPVDTGRPEVCNNEWTGGGLTIIED